MTDESISDILDEAVELCFSSNPYTPQIFRWSSVGDPDRWPANCEIWDFADDVRWVDSKSIKLSELKQKASLCRMGIK